MKAICAYIFVALLFLFSTTAAATVEAGTFHPFRLRAWGFSISNSTAPIDNFVELDASTGDVIVNSTAKWKGFVCYLDPRSEGFLRKADNRNLGYLFPLYPLDNGDSDGDGFVGDFAFRFGPGVPKIKNVLYTNFTIISRSCGDNCGGPALDYDEGKGMIAYGTWYVVPRGGGHEGVWALRWTNREKGLVVPPDGVQVLLWKN